jgi:hypothetical protein
MIHSVKWRQEGEVRNIPVEWQFEAKKNILFWT